MTDIIIARCKRHLTIIVVKHLITWRHLLKKLLKIPHYAAGCPISFRIFVLGKYLRWQLEISILKKNCYCVCHLLNSNSLLRVLSVYNSINNSVQPIRHKVCRKVRKSHLHKSAEKVNVLLIKFSNMAFPIKFTSYWLHIITNAFTHRKYVQ